MKAIFKVGEEFMITQEMISKSGAKLLPGKYNIKEVLNDNAGELWYRMLEETGCWIRGSLMLPPEILDSQLYKAMNEIS
jgi:hypothetical protein